MRGLSLIIFILFLYLDLPPEGKSDSPHGEELEISCEDCHTSDGWEVNEKTISFRHNVTNFQLVGTHQEASCASCHSSLVFSDASPDCMSCHTDMHEQTVGFDCARCHTSNSWLVNNTTEMHQLSRFPLLGAHATADCFQCHETASLLRFDPLGTECIDCHQTDYATTTSPNHNESGYSTDCVECHQMNAFSWTGPNFTHTFFPLTLGHDIRDCNQCHISGTDYSNVSSDCFSCHESDYTASSNPNHQQANLSTNCLECHTTNPGWRPADFRIHDNLYFPIYSGEHNGEWESCTDCHTTPSNYSIFTCIDCHEHNSSEMNEEHNDISGYVYSSNACFECHPTGSEDFIFNHSSSNFPLTGEHINAECASCHTNGYEGTSSNCFECHTPDFNQSINPNHISIGLSNDCASCHTTNANWQPATLNNHNEFYVLAGAHNTIASECNACHNGDYNNTANTCIACHQNEYNQTTDPPHASAQFSTDCLLCHTESAWEPSTFEHDGQYFPIYSGEHNGEWNSCADCHTSPGDYALFSCIDCHEHNQTEMNDEHSGVSGYNYSSPACLDCHPNGEEDFKIHHLQNIRR